MKETKFVIHSYPYDKDNSPSTLEIDKHSGKINIVTIHDPVSVKQIKANFLNGFFDTFLPSGYPHSVADGYLRFTMYSNISALAITAMSFLSAQSLFVALGSSMNQANIAAAAYTWVLKDGLGQLGGILFASRYGKNFDEDIKKWRFMAQVALNLSIYIDILTLKYP